MRGKIVSTCLSLVAAGAFVLVPDAGADWTSRSMDLQNTANVGDQPGLTPENVSDLQVSRIWQPQTPGGEKDGAPVNHTPVITNDLMIFGDWMGRLYVVDLTRNAGDPQDDILILLETPADGSTTGRGRMEDSAAAPATSPLNEASGGVVHRAMDEYTTVGHLGEELGNYAGFQSTPTVGTVTLPNGEEQLRVYAAVISSDRNIGGLYCLNLSKVLEDRDDPTITLTRDDGTDYLCDQPDVDGDGTPDSVWPRSLVPEGSNQTVINGSPMLSENQPYAETEEDNDGTIDGQRDILYTPSTGLDCADGRMWAMDPVTGEILWDFDPVTNGVIQGNTGGVIWTTPAMNRDRSLVYVTTGNCVGRPQVGEKAEALVALDAQTGEVAWWHQRRLIDTADLDIGVGPTVVDVDEYPGCHVVVSGDKDGCMYAYEQEPDIPEIGEVGYDPLRPGQQRVLWRKCFVPGTLNGGFNSSNGALHGRTFIQQTNAYPGGHNGADDSNAFGVDACTGKVEWASSDIGAGRTDAAIASDMLFQISAYRILPGTKVGYRFYREVHVTAADSGIGRVPDVLATVVLPSQPSLGGGGVSIANNRLYVPIVGGVAEVMVVPGSNASPPRKYGQNVFAGPYPAPIAPGGVDAAMPTVNPDDPYPLMLENPNPTAVVESIEGYQGRIDREVQALRDVLGADAEVPAP